MKKIITGILLLIFPLISNGQSEMLPIDSLYLNSVSKFYQYAKQVKNDIWPAMEISPVCLFRTNGPAILYGHPNPPESFIKTDDNIFIGSQREMHLAGATQMEINGVSTAIIDYGYDHYSTPEEVYAELFHEIHHVYQLNKIENIEYDNPAILLVYPEDTNNDALKLYEQQILLKMVFTDDKNQFDKYLNEFYSCRLKREKIIGKEFLDYEKTVENMEGPAFYCEYRFYNEKAVCDKIIKEHYNFNHFWSVLNTPYYGRTSLRLRHLSAGMAMCYILDKFHDSDWKKEYYSQNSGLFDFFMSKFNPQIIELPDLKIYYSLSNYHTTESVLQHERVFDEFSSQPGIKIILEFASVPQFRGFDPMNANAINDSIVLHNTLLNLGNENNKLFITNHDIATIYKGQIWFVDKAVFFVSNKSEIKNIDDKIIISSEDIDFEWSGEIISEEKNKIIIKCQ